MSLCQLAHQKQKFLNRIELSLLTNGRPQNLNDFRAVSRRILQTGARILAEFFAEDWALVINMIALYTAVILKNKHTV